MEEMSVYRFLEEKKDLLFPNKQYTSEDLEDALMDAPDSFELTMRSIPLRNPSTVQIIAFFPGSLGVDRFYLGDIGKGILKYFTFAGFGVWWIMDIFSAKDRCRAYNCKKLMDAVNDPSVAVQMVNTDDKINSAISGIKKAAPVVKEIVKGAKEVGDTFNVR